MQFHHKQSMNRRELIRFLDLYSTNSLDGEFYTDPDVNQALEMMHRAIQESIIPAPLKAYYHAKVRLGGVSLWVDTLAYKLMYSLDSQF